MIEKGDIQVGNMIIVEETPELVIGVIDDEDIFTIDHTGCIRSVNWQDVENIIGLTDVDEGLDILKKKCAAFVNTELKK
jgi:hypothetical protein